MKTKQTRQLNLFAGGRDEWEETGEYRDKVNKIIREVTDKYSPALSNEPNWIKRIFIKLRLRNEIRKKIDELSSTKNLHTIDSSSLLFD